MYGAFADTEHLRRGTHGGLIFHDIFAEFYCTVFNGVFQCLALLRSVNNIYDRKKADMTIKKRISSA